MEKKHPCALLTRDRWKRIARYFYLRFTRLQGQAEKIAGGMAIGVFIGMTPTIPLHTVLAVSLAYISGRSKLAAALGVWVANPAVLPFIYYLDFKVGQLITGATAPSFVPGNFSLTHLIEMGWRISSSMLIGGCITGILLAIPSYFLTKRLVILYRQK
ncbi:MAG: DUF2062 domain-containing protein, partial [Deltaproteobacteria bacterium]|nr:DUF2062 domain-containing protein [Deltaproteobacteria bacterium]